MKSIATIVCLLAFHFSMSLSQTWTSINPQTGFKNVRDFAMRQSGDTLYAADEINLLKSTDGGVTWSATSSVVASPIAVTCQWNRQKIVLISGSDFFKRSTDGGSNWTDLGSGMTNKPTALASFTQQTNVMLLGRKHLSNAERAIARSVDSGATWSQELSVGTTILDFAIEVSGANGAYAVAAGAPTGSQSVRALYHTDDYGASWTTKMSTSTYVGWSAAALFKSATVDTEWAGTVDGRLFKGKFNSTLTQVSSFPVIADTIRAIRISKSDYKIVYVATDRTVYKTTNNGSSWSIVSSGMADSRFYSMEIKDGSDNILIGGSRGYLYRTTNSGSSWSSSSSTTTRILPTYSVAPRSQYTWSGTNEFTVAGRYDGSSWNSARLVAADDSAFLGKQIQSNLDASNAWRVFDVGATAYGTSRVFLSVDSGASYTDQSAFVTNVANTSVEGLSVDPSRPQKLYAYGKLAEGSNGRNYFTNDNYGTNADWVKSAGQVTTDKWLTLNPMGDGTGTGGASNFIYSGIESAGLRRTANGGTNWDQITSATLTSTITINATACNKNVLTVAYAGGAGGLWVSTNANTPVYTNVTLTHPWSTANVNKILIDPRFTHSSYSSSYIFWVGSNNIIYRSEDGGTTASSVFGNLPSGVVINDLRSNPTDSTAIYIATDKGVYKAQLPVPPSLTYPTVADNGNILYCISSTENLTFTWASVSGATSYDIQLDSLDNTFTHLVANTNVATTSYSYGTDLICNRTYYWRVRSSDGTGFGKSPYVTASFLTAPCSPGVLAAPTLSSPSNAATGVSCHPTLSWGAVTGAIKYYVEVSGFGAQIVTGTAAAFSGLSASHTYSWKVRALNCNSSNPYSAIWTFTTGSQCIDGPGPNISENGPKESSAPTEFGLSQNFPNPFNPTTTFSYSIPVGSQVSLKIFNTLGQEVATLVNKYEEPGFHSVEFDASRLSSGIYFFRLQAEGHSFMKKMLLMK